MKTILATLFACGAILSTGVGRADPPAAQETPAHVTFAVATDRSNYPAASGGSAATLYGTATLTNTGDQTLRYMYSARTLRWQVLDSSGSVVYDDSVGRMIPMFVMIRTLDPGKSATFTANFALTHQGGAPLEPGRYTLRVHFGGDLDLTSSAGFTVGK